MAMPQQQMNNQNFNTQPTSTGGNYNFFTGTTAKNTQIPKYNQNQQAAFAQALQQALSGLQNPSAGFDPIAQKARTQFKTQTVPGIAERFEALGGGSDRGGSALTGQLGSAGAGLEESLAALQSQYGLQQQGLLQQLLGLGLTEQNENIYEPAQGSEFMSLINALLQAGGQLGGAAIKAYA